MINQLLVVTDDDVTTELKDLRIVSNGAIIRKSSSVGEWGVYEMRFGRLINSFEKLSDALHFTGQ